MTRATIFAGPAVQELRRVEDLLHGMDDQWPVETACNICIPLMRSR